MAPDQPLAALLAAPPSDLTTIIQQIDQETESWRAELSVSIGQAQQMTGLKDSQIRYYEELEALRPRKTSAQSGASRLFTIADLRRLRVLALLAQQGLRPAEAAELVKQYSQAIDTGVRKPIATIVRQERSAVADGFFLTRLITQIIEAAQAELADPALGASLVRVRGAVLPLRRVFSCARPTPAELEAVGDQLLHMPADMLVALIEQSSADDLRTMPPALLEAGRDEQTVLFYSREPHALGLSARYRYCAYVPPAAPEQAVLLLLELPDDAQPAMLLQPRDETRRQLLDMLLALCADVAVTFCNATLSKDHRYRSDGFPLSLTHESTAELLQTIRAALFPGDDAAMAVLMVPDSLDQPESLSILAHCGYDDALAARARLDLRGEQGQGLSGRAYRLREPFLSLHADADRRVEYALEEGSQQALAVPLATTWSLSPFGVLYLATRSRTGCLDSQRAYAALILGSILSELLGRWWLTRLRKELDQSLHRRLPNIVDWLDSLDGRGPAFQRGMAQIGQLWHATQAALGDPALLRQRLTLAVLDIDHYRRNVQVRTNEPLPLQAQRHVREAIRRVDPALESYWFRNDHALLILPTYNQTEAMDLLLRIVDQVGLTPLQLPNVHGLLRPITVSAAFKVLTYQALCDLGSRGEEQLLAQVGAIVRQLCAATRREGTGKVVPLGASLERDLAAGVGRE